MTKTDNDTIFHKAAREDMVELIKRANIRDLNLPDDFGMSPVHWAAHKGHLSTLRMIVGKGGDIEKTDKDGKTAIHHAALNGHLNCVSFLVSFGANLWALDNEFKTALDLASLGEHFTTLEYLDYKIAERIRSEGSKITKLKDKSLRDATKRIKARRFPISLNFSRYREELDNSPAKHNKKVNVNESENEPNWTNSQVNGNVTLNGHPNLNNLLQSSPPSLPTNNQNYVLKRTYPPDVSTTYQQVLTPPTYKAINEMAQISEANTLSNINGNTHFENNDTSSSLAYESIASTNDATHAPHKKQFNSVNLDHSKLRSKRTSFQGLMDKFSISKPFLTLSRKRRSTANLFTPPSGSFPKKQNDKNEVERQGENGVTPAQLHNIKSCPQIKAPGLYEGNGIFIPNYEYFNTERRCAARPVVSSALFKHCSFDMYKDVDADIRSTYCSTTNCSIGTHGTPRHIKNRRVTQPINWYSTVSSSGLYRRPKINGGCLGSLNAISATTSTTLLNDEYTSNAQNFNYNTSIINGDNDFTNPIQMGNGLNAMSTSYHKGSFHSPKYCKNVSLHRNDNNLLPDLNNNHVLTMMYDHHMNTVKYHPQHMKKHFFPQSNTTLGKHNRFSMSSMGHLNKLYQENLANTYHNGIYNTPTTHSVSGEKDKNFIINNTVLNGYKVPEDLSSLNKLNDKNCNDKTNINDLNGVVCKNGDVKCNGYSTGVTTKRPSLLHHSMLFHNGSGGEESKDRSDSQLDLNDGTTKLPVTIPQKAISAHNILQSILDEGDTIQEIDQILDTLSISTLSTLRNNQRSNERRLLAHVTLFDEIKKVENQNHNDLLNAEKNQISCSPIKQKNQNLQENNIQNCYDSIEDLYYKATNNYGAFQDQRNETNLICTKL